MYIFATFGIFADIVGVMGGMVIAYTSLDITYVEFINRLQNEVPVKHLLLGVLKLYFWIFYSNYWLF